MQLKSRRQKDRISCFWDAFIFTLPKKVCSIYLNRYKEYMKTETYLISVHVLSNDFGVKIFILPLGHQICKAIRRMQFVNV